MICELLRLREDDVDIESHGQVLVGRQRDELMKRPQVVQDVIEHRGAAFSAPGHGAVVYDLDEEARVDVAEVIEARQVLCIRVKGTP